MGKKSIMAAALVAAFALLTGCMMDPAWTRAAIDERIDGEALAAASALYPIPEGSVVTLHAGYAVVYRTSLTPDALVAFYADSYRSRGNAELSRAVAAGGAIELRFAGAAGGRTIEITIEDDVSHRTVRLLQD